MKDILISIIIPIYNAENYIIRCLESIINQDYQDCIECILIDDCSKDNSVQIVTNFIHTQKSSQVLFKILYQKSNQGASVARNTGLLQAKGKYIFFLDADDELISNGLSSLIKLTYQYPQAEIIQSGALCLEQGKEWTKQPWLNFERIQRPEYIDNPQWIKTYILSMHFLVAPWCKLIKRNFILRNNLLFKPGIIHEDDHWCYFLSKHVKHIAFLNKNILIHYINANSVMRTRSKDNKSYNSWCIIWKDMVTNIDDFCKKAQIQKILSSTISWYLFDKSSKTRKEIRHIIKELKNKIPNELTVSFMLYLYLPHFIQRRPFMYQYFINKFTNNVIYEK